MTFATIDARKAYAKAHYEKNKSRYNPAREAARRDAMVALAKTQADAKRSADKEKAKEIAKEKARAEKERIAAGLALKKIPATLEGQLAVILREHFANELPDNKNRRRGANYPLSAWMLGAPQNYESKILAVCANAARYPYYTNKASSDVLVDRIASRYELTFVQKSLLARYVSLRYRGKADRYGMMQYIGTDATGPIFLGQGFTRSIQLIRWACKKFKLNPDYMPLSAIIDKRVTNILLLIQLNELIQSKKYSY